MLKSERIKIIEQASKNPTEKVSPSLSLLIQELKEEKLSQDLVAEYGLLQANKQDIEDEFQNLDCLEDRASQKENFDEDEELKAMDFLSSRMREIFGE
jgi:hypothetical protein